MRIYSGIVENGFEEITQDVIEDWAYDDGWELFDLYVQGDGSVDFEFEANAPGNFSRDMQEASLGMLSILIERAHKRMTGGEAFVQWTNLG